MTRRDGPPLAVPYYQYTLNFEYLSQCGPIYSSALTDGTSYSQLRSQDLAEINFIKNCRKNDYAPVRDRPLTVDVAAWDGASRRGGRCVRVRKMKTSAESPDENENI